MDALRLFRPLLLSVLALSLGVGCTRAYIQNEGPYEFKVVEVLRDDCGLLPSPANLWPGELYISGEVVRMRYGLMDALLVGRFLDGSSEDDDAFSMDGSVPNASLTAKDGTECIVDQVSMHLDAITQCATEFDGVLSVRYEPRFQQASCACQLWVRYQAVQDNAPCASGL
ncbi:hypothetical protein [Vitiosangium sp. GDMCC 1.1324]|uniref:hypothetical protein n=1 Tax=Vitiosangium sp. (strain GDMCC 1.1324) TaxID=2138576 RepID=UPI001E2B6D99|nr:hypothetical protein [Vitiosangium sp. GDMCC 1.1324]